MPVPADPATLRIAARAEDKSSFWPGREANRPSGCRPTRYYLWVFDKVVWVDFGVNT